MADEKVVLPWVAKGETEDDVITRQQVLLASLVANVSDKLLQKAIRDADKYLAKKR